MKIRYSILIIVSLFLTGCGEVLNEYYLSNNTGIELYVQLEPTAAGHVELLSGPLQRNIDSSVRGELDTALAAAEDGDLYLLTIPPDTTVLLGSSGGGDDLFKYLEISGGIDSPAYYLTMDDTNYGDYFVVTDNFVGPIVHVYQVD